MFLDFDLPAWFIAPFLLVALIMVSSPIILIYLIAERKSRSEGWYVGLSCLVLVGALFWVIAAIMKFKG